MTGKLSSIPHEKPYGFIDGEDGKRYFFHQSAFEGHWNDLVHDFQHDHINLEFQPDSKKSDKGPRAKEVRRVDWPNQ